MKRYFFLLFASVFVWESCESEVSSVKEKDYAVVSINLAGDYVEISSGPLSKANTPKAYYAFQIEERVIESYRDENGEVYYEKLVGHNHYADGIFDQNHVSNLSVMLEKGKSYRIRCDMIKDRVDHLYVDSEGCLYRPFNYNLYNPDANIKVFLNNMFIYGTEKTINVGSKLISINEQEQVYCPELDRYFGEAITDGDAVSIELERQNFGLHFILNSPGEGILQVSQSSWSPQFSYILNPGDSSIDEEHIYVFNTGNYFAVDKDNNPRQQIIYLNVVWKRENGETLDLSPEPFPVYNKTMTTIKVDVNDRIGGTGISFTLNDTINSADEITIN